jgi:hypothetical protein
MHLKIGFFCRWERPGLFSKAKELSARRANTRRAQSSWPAVKLLSGVA